MSVQSAIIRFGKLLISLVVLLNHETLTAQYFPGKDVILNYNQVMFEYPQHHDAAWYKIEIAYNVTGNSKNDIEKNLFISQTDSSTACLISSIPFGKKYFWRVLAYNKDQKLIHASPIINFALMVCDYCDTTQFRHKQYYNIKEKYKDGLIWCDTYHCAIDRFGNVVWFFPIINRSFENPAAMRDLRIHNDGTISFVNDSNIYLIDRNLNVLWNGPKTPVSPGQREQHYHHAFNVISPDNFYTLGSTYKKLYNKTGIKDSLENYFVNDYVIQYDSLGKIKWMWDYAKEFFNEATLNALPERKKFQYLHPHLNAVSVDSQEKYVYVSLRNLSCILKIEKSTNKIVASFGQRFFNSDTIAPHDVLFDSQHDVKYIGNGCVTLFNNNSDASSKDESKKPGCVSSVEMLELPANNHDNAKIIWEFKTNFDTLSDYCSTRFGSADLLENKNFLVCAGQNGRLFEVTKDKKIVWDMTLYKKIKNVKIFEKLPQYRIMYSSSLYPYFFTFKKSGDTVIIYNEGSENDSYELTIFDKKKIVYSEKLNIEKGKTGIISIPKNFIKKARSFKVKSTGSQTIKTLDH